MATSVTPKYHEKYYNALTKIEGEKSKYHQLLAEKKMSGQ